MRVDVIGRALTNKHQLTTKTNTCQTKLLSTTPFWPGLRGRTYNASVHSSSGQACDKCTKEKNGTSRREVEQRRKRKTVAQETPILSQLVKERMHEGMCHAEAVAGDELEQLAEQRNSVNRHMLWEQLQETRQ